MAQTQKIYKAGDIIMRQGDKGESAFIIEQGRVEIVLEQPDGTMQVVGTRGPGAMIGEMALVDNAPRTATVRAIENCQLLEITHKDFSRRLDHADPILRMTTQVILTRYRDTLTRSSITGKDRPWLSAEAVELGYAEQGRAVETIKLANEFEHALKNGQLSLHYQPMIDLTENRIVGFEALMRWNHPERGFISPGLFIPIAEETGLIVAASQWALREACKALKRIGGRTGHFEDLFMSVNFSSADFATGTFPEDIANIISSCDIAPQQIHLEITERLLIGQPDRAREALTLCQQAGMGISIDDFGTGYSSLSYLHYFPINILKIDQKFIQDMRKKDSALELVRSIIALGKNMKMKVIAEGVEHAEEAEELKLLGCDIAQGYYFARPMPELDVTNFVRNF